MSRECRRACGARGRRWGPGSLRSVRRSVQRLQKGLRRAWSPLGARLSPQCPETAEGSPARVVAAGGPALSAVAGAGSRDCRRGRRACGARGRRWGPGCLAQCSETAEGAAARVVAAGGPALSQCPATAEVPAARVVAAGGPALSAVSGAVSRDCRSACGARGRRWGPGSVQRLQKGLRRAWSPLGVRLSPQCRRSVQRLQKGLRRAWSPLGARLSGAVSRDCRRACGARGRWGPGSLRSVRRSVQRLQKGLRRAWSPLGARLSGVGGPALSAVSGAVFRDCRRACGAGGRRWGPGSLKGLRRAWSPLGARLSPQCPAQCPETAEGAAARVVAAGGPALSAVSGAVSRDCRRACGARGRRWGPGSLAQCPETAEGPAARVVAGGPARVVAAGGPALSAVSGAVSRDCRRACGARGRRWGPGSLAQCSETALLPL